MVAEIDPDFIGEYMVNNVEITEASNALGQEDEDDPIGGLNNIGESDDEDELDTDNDHDDDGENTPGVSDTAGDQDDYDPALVEVHTFDLAIQKNIDANATPGPYEQGSLVTFSIDVYNQGNVDATAVNIVDYIPTGMNFVDST